jgi:hypothetical protein
LQGGPWKEVWLRNVTPRRPGGGGPAKFRPTAGRGRPGEGPWVPRGRFQGLIGPGKGSARGGAGGQAWWPPRPVCRRGRLDAEGVGRLASFGRGREGWWQGRFGTQPARAWRSPWLPTMAPPAARTGWLGIWCGGERGGST